MMFYSVDSIVKGVLLPKGYTMHWYLEYLCYARDILLELHLDDMKAINTVILNLDANNSAPLPCDYIDESKVGVKVGQLIRPLVKQGSINRLPNRDTTGNIIPYTGDPSQQANLNISYGYIPTLYWSLTTFNDYGENLGRLAGYGAGFQTDTYKIIPEQNRIQFNEYLPQNQAVLEYISDGTGTVGTLGVTPLAKSTITTYLDYMKKLNKRGSTDAEIGRAWHQHTNQRKVFRARNSDFGIEELKRILEDAYYNTPKLS